MYEPGLIMGHEFSGVIETTGDRVELWQPGDRITANDAIPCGGCPSCRAGQPTLCDDLLMPGITLNGGMAEYSVLPARALHRLPQEVTLRQGALVEPAAVALHGVGRSTIAAGDPALVMGAGPIGLLTLQFARMAGAEAVYVSEVDPFRRALALELGALEAFDPDKENLAVELASRTRGEGPAVVYLCTGSRAAFEDAVTLVAKGGEILVLGLGVEPVEADFFTVALRELSIRGSYLGYEEFSAAIGHIAAGNLQVDPLITHEIGLGDLLEAGLRRLETPGSEAVKILVRPDS
jgi:(R,R)-butanediol dehydrogenase/meso-butanediol dehydrogenase/diacetyl reductase